MTKWSELLHPDIDPGVWVVVRRPAVHKGNPAISRFPASPRASRNTTLPGVQLDPRFTHVKRDGQGIFCMESGPCEASG